MLISFYYGEKNDEKLKKLLRISFEVIAVISAVTVVSSLALTKHAAGHRADQGKRRLFACNHVEGELIHQQDGDDRMDALKWRLRL